MRQKAYESELLEKVAAIETASKRFSQIAATCSYQKQDEIQIGLRQAKSEVQFNRLAIQHSQNETNLNFAALGDTIRAESKESRQGVESKLMMLQGQFADLLEAFLSSNKHIDPRTGHRK